MINLEYVANYFKCLTENIQLIILGEEHGDPIEHECQEELIKKITLDYGLIEHPILKEGLEDKFKSIRFELCDFSDEEKKIVQKDILKCYLPQKFDEIICYPYDSIDSFFYGCAIEHKCIDQIFRAKREKKMGEIIIENLGNSSKTIIAIVGHSHAMESSNIHKVLKKEKISYITIWKDGNYCKKCNFQIEENYKKCPICETNKDPYTHMKIYDQSV